MHYAFMFQYCNEIKGNVLNGRYTLVFTDSEDLAVSHVKGVISELFKYYYHKQGCCNSCMDSYLQMIILKRPMLMLIWSFGKNGLKIC